MAENPFRILLDFRDLNFKFYKFVWMSVSPRELVTIKDLKNAILKKFSFERTDLHLFLRDGLLPEDENITNILRENDSVKLFHTESSSFNLNESETKNLENESTASNEILTPSKKRKPQSDVSVILEDNEQEKHNKKRKHSFSNGTYLFENNNTSENSALMNADSFNIENTSSASLNNFEEQSSKSCKIRKKLKYTNDVPQSSLISENATCLSSDIIPRLEKNEGRIKSCKKKKKHSKDNVTTSEINENQPMSQKKKKKLYYSQEVSKTGSISKTADSFCDGIHSISENLDNSVDDLESISIEQSGLKKNIFETVTDNSEILKMAPDSFNTSSVNTSSGIGSLKSSKENKRIASLGKHYSKSSASDNKPVSETDENTVSSQGNNCKKKKRKRHKRRKSSLILPQVDISNDWNLNGSSSKEESLESSFASTYQTAKEISVDSKTNTKLSTKNTNSLEQKNTFKKPFSNWPPSTSTPFSQTNTASTSLKSVINQIPNDSNISQGQSSFTSQNSSQEKMNKSSLSTHSLSSKVTKKKNNVSFASNNLNEKSLFTKINNSDKSNDSFDTKQINSEFLDSNSFYKTCPSLNSCPIVGTHIAYKVLELDASYSPVVSNYKEGYVTAINPQTDELEIELIEPEIKEGRIGKFENLYEDELPLCEVVEKVSLSWPSLIDPVQVVCQ